MGSVRRGVVVVAFAVLVLLSGAQYVFAGQDASGSIVGQVTDDSGGVLPGVTVTAKSPALQTAEVVSVTNQNGEYARRCRLAPTRSSSRCKASRRCVASSCGSPSVSRPRSTSR